MPDVREERIQRGTTFGVALVAALVGILFVTAGEARVPRSAYTLGRLTTFVEIDTTTTSVAPTTSTAPAAPSTSVASATTTTPATGDPGALPQTDERPSASGTTFTTGVDDLWEAIRQDKPELALPFFFPKSAYLQVKAISDPAGDYQNRLIANYEEDIHTLHAQLGANAANAAFTGISVPDAQAVFVQPGEESNKGSYWRVYGTTMQYEVDGQTGSFPVTSLISWRGQWYVVHLGAIR
ncbi:MAG TPA: hypothetical protein VGN51_08990 [Acidimicrobiia bacterium]